MKSQNPAAKERIYPPSNHFLKKLWKATFRKKICFMCFRGFIVWRYCVMLLCYTMLGIILFHSYLFSCSFLHSCSILNFIKKAAVSSQKMSTKRPRILDNVPGLNFVTVRVEGSIPCSRLVRCVRLGAFRDWSAAGVKTWHLTDQTLRGQRSALTSCTATSEHNRRSQRQKDISWQSAGRLGTRECLQ